MNRKLIATAIALASLASASAFAAPYVGGSVGLSHVDIEDCDCDKDGFAAKIFAGYEFTNNLAAEVTYYSLGKATEQDVDFKGAYWGLGGAWRPQFGNGWGGVARAGAAFVTGKIESGPVSFSHDSTHPYFGLGVTYALEKNVRLELDFDSTEVTHAAYGASMTSTVNSLMFGVTYGF